MPGLQPAHILQGLGQNPPRPGGRGNWTSKIAGGSFMRGPNPEHGWVPVYDPNSNHGGPAIEVVGTIVNTPHVSSEDLPFLHPFGNDFEFHVAPDKAYFPLVAPNMVKEYAESTRRAKDLFGLIVPGVIGVEMDGNLVAAHIPHVSSGGVIDHTEGDVIDHRPELPNAPEQGDRVGLWGRLIVDAGHDDFHTEIHPPLVLVHAHRKPMPGQQPGDHRGGETAVEIITRPFLVSQDFDHGGLFNQLAIQLAETLVNPFPTGTIDAHPKLMPEPFIGSHTVRFIIRPPRPFGPRPTDRLFLRSMLTQRTGIEVTAAERPGEPNAVEIMIRLDSRTYVPPRQPARHDRTVSATELAGDAIGAMILTLMPKIPPNLAIVVAKGFPTHSYERVVRVSATQSSGTAFRPVAGMKGRVPTNVDDSQPFPLLASLRLEWVDGNVID